MLLCTGYRAVTRNLRLSSVSAERAGTTGEEALAAIGDVDVDVAERPKRGILNGSRLGGDSFSLGDTTGSDVVLARELNFSNVPLETMCVLAGVDISDWSWCSEAMLLFPLFRYEREPLFGLVCSPGPTALSSVAGLALSPRLIHLRTSGWSVFCLLRLSSTCFHKLAILLVTTFFGGVLFSWPQDEDTSSTPLAVVATVESDPMLALLTERLLMAGLPFDRGEDKGLGPLRRGPGTVAGFLGTVGLALASALFIFIGLGGTLGGTLHGCTAGLSGSGCCRCWLCWTVGGDREGDDWSLVNVPCLPMLAKGA